MSEIEDDKEPRRCVFCGGTPVTREHVWPQWLVNAVVAHARTQDPDSPVVWDVVRLTDKPRKVTKFDAAANRTCASCNNTWLSDIDNAVKPILTRIMLGQQFALDLTPDLQRTLGIWAFKTALLSDFLQSTQFFPASAYARFYRERAPTAAYDQIWIAGYVGSKGGLGSTVLQLEGNISHSYGANGILTRKLTPLAGTTCTLRVIWAVFQVVVFEGCHPPLTDEPIGGPVRQIWPLSGRTFSWPPDASVFEDKGLVDFTVRSGRVRSARADSVSGKWYLR